jgi:hypothetical protein
MNSKSGKRLKNLCFRWKNAATTTPKIDGGAKKKKQNAVDKGLKGTEEKEKETRSQNRTGDRCIDFASGKSKLTPSNKMEP